MITFVKYLIVFIAGIASMYLYNQTFKNEIVPTTIEKITVQKNCIKERKIEDQEVENPNKDFYKMLESYEVESNVKPVTVQTVYSKNSNSNNKYKCDGREYCSQMTSCEEATFFINNCPNTKMDGDGDGVPCWKQWCGH